MKLLQRIWKKREAETSVAPHIPVPGQEALAKRQEIEKIQREAEKVSFMNTTMEPSLASYENPLN